MGDIKKWPIFNLVSSEFLSRIRVAFVYGNDVCNTLIVTYDNMVYKIENNVQWSPKYNHYDSSISPIKVDTLCELDIKTFTFSALHILVLTYGGMVYYISNKFFKQNGSIRENAVPNIMNKHFNNETVNDIACGRYCYLVLTSSGKVYESITGNNGHAVHEVTTNINKKIVCISCGHESNTIVTVDGEVYSWGRNSVGQLGFGDHMDQKNPSIVTGLLGVKIKKVACGYMHVLALSNDGDLYVWGANSCGQLGVCATDIDAPVKLDAPEMGKVVDIAASYHHNISIALGTGNRVFMWGQCLGQNIDVPTLTSVSSIHDAFAFYASPRVMHQPLMLYKSYENHVLDSIKNVFNDPTTSDLTIQVHGNPIYVHKSIIMIRCQYFRKMLQKDCEKKDQRVIEENMFSHDVYKAFLQYLYTDQVDLPPEDTFELWKLANYYSMYHLKKYCMQSICKHITVKNVIYLYSTAITYNVKELENSCLKFILKNMTAVVQTPSFAELDGSMIKKCVIKAAEAGVFRT